MSRREESSIEKTSKDTSLRDKRFSKNPLKGVNKKEESKLKKWMGTNGA